MVGGTFVCTKPWFESQDNILQLNGNDVVVSYVQCKYQVLKIGYFHGEKWRMSS